MSLIRQAYNNAAHTYRMKYDAIPVRADEIDQVLNYVGAKSPHVVEIGCAYGREAAYILTKTPHYTGVDICDEYIDMAQQELPKGKFIRADVLNYEWPDKIDIIFAFASLLHLSQDSLKSIFESMANRLVPGGVIFISLKRGEGYACELVDDGYSKRQFYYYSRDIINAILPKGLVEVHYAEQQLKEPWLTMILQKTARE